jgi:4-phytase/acid phosphatase
MQKSMQAGFAKTARQLTPPWLVATFLIAPFLIAPFRSMAQLAPPAMKLEYVAVLSRHGVRSALLSLDALREYSSQPWHPMTVPLGYLTPHGRTEMQMTGSWDRQYLRQNGLIAGAPGCEDASRFYFRADSIQRDIESARAMALTMFPECNVPIHSSPAGTPDPMFLGADSPGLVDRELAGAALEGRTGGDPWLILKAHASDVAIVQEILTGNGPAPKKTLLTPVPLGR